MCAPASRAPLTTPGVSAGSYWSSPIDSSSVYAGHQLVLVGVVDVRLQPGGDRGERGGGRATRQRHRTQRSTRPLDRLVGRVGIDAVVGRHGPALAAAVVVTLGRLGASVSLGAVVSDGAPVVPGASVPADAVVSVGASVLTAASVAAGASVLAASSSSSSSPQAAAIKDAAARTAAIRDVRRIMVVPPGGRVVVGARRSRRAAQDRSRVATTVRTPVPPRPLRQPRWRGPGSPPACRPAWARSRRSSGRCA